MNGNIIAIVVIAAVAVLAGAALLMSGSSDNGGSSTVDTADSRTADTTLDTGEGSDKGSSNSANNTSTEYPFTVTFQSGTENACTITKVSGEYKVTFSGLKQDSSYLLAGILDGSITIEAGDYDFELVLNGVTITSSTDVPVCITTGENVFITAKKNTTNYIYDNRSEVPDDGISASVYCKCDLKLKGNGTLVIVSENNNGIHTKDDLSVKNLTLYITCVDNCLKGNDSVTITSGTLTLNATSGDGIKTSSTDVSSKGIQRGTVTVNSDDGDTKLTIKSYCDGIDAAFDVVIQETGNNSVAVDIIAGTGASLKSSTIGASITASIGAPGTGPGWGGRPGGNSWEQGGPDSDGNKNTVDYSCKGIKAGNSIAILSGTVTIDAYDDALHANSDDSMESGVIPTGNITISGGKVTLNSMDDGMHADGTLTISGGTVSVTGSYEGLEGTFVNISGGNVSIVSTDDGINGVTSYYSYSEGIITLSGGTLYVYAGGDGIDSNCSGTYKGISFEGTDVTIVSSSGGNSSIDTNAGYTYKSGKVLAICPTGMTQEISRVSNWSSVASTATGSLSSGTTVKVTVGGSIVASVKMPVSISNAYIIYLGSSNAAISTA